MRVDLRFIYDAGHGWLEVPNDLLATVLAPDVITHYSYMRGDDSYLEEDLDAPRFLKAAKEQGFEVVIQEKDDGVESRIRNYDKFNSRRLRFSNPFLQEGVN